MRKRTIISIILVLVILGLSHNAWLTIRPKPQSTVTSIRGGGGEFLNRNKQAFDIAHPCEYQI